MNMSTEYNKITPVSHRKKAAEVFYSLIRDFKKTNPEFIEVDCPFCGSNNATIMSNSVPSTEGFKNPKDSNIKIPSIILVMPLNHLVIRKTTFFTYHIKLYFIYHPLFQKRKN